MTEEVAGWEIDAYRTAYASGATVVDVIERVLAIVEALPAAVLIGPPLSARAKADAGALAGVPPDSLPLYGVPYVVKDNVDVAGVPTTAGCPGFATVAEADATVVARLRAAGAIVVGKTNLDQFATGLVGTRSPHGSPPNVLRADLVPGGSSSGSAVAVALGAVPFSIGTDTAGSGRVPAALNGIVGLKPTLGWVSSAGIVPAVRRLDCPSVFARSVGDAQAVVAVIAGPDPRDCLTRPRPPVHPLRWPPVIGVPAAWRADVEPSAEMGAWFATAVDRLRALGATVVEVDVGPALELGRMLYGSAVVAERAAAVGDAIVKGVDGLDPTVASIIADSMHWSAVDAYRAEYRLADLRAAFHATWDDVDVLALPTTSFLPTRAAVRADPIGVNRAIGALTTFVNLADAACLVVPMEPGVPAGLQLVAPAWHDDELAALAAAYVAGAPADREPAPR